MSFANSRTFGGRSRTTSSTNAAPQLMTAVNSFNQLALNRLQERYELAANKERYQNAISKAMTSLAACPTPITTFAEALKLRNVGQHCAGIICPHDKQEQQQQTTGGTRRRQVSSSKKKKTIRDDHDDDSSDDDSDDDDSSSDENVAPVVAAAAASSSSSKNKKININQKRRASSISSSSSSTSTMTKKEKAYQIAKLEAQQKWCHPILYNSRTNHASGLEWKVLLLVDNREPNYQHIISRCTMCGIPAEERALPIGDMMWIAQGIRRHSGGASVVEVELLLGTIIERKTTTDFFASFVGTRYAEQRLRLRHSGQAQIIFLLEGDIRQSVSKKLNASRMQMALWETRTQLGFQVLNTNHFEDTIHQLQRIHHCILQRTFPDIFTNATAGNQMVMELVLEIPPKLPPSGFGLVLAQEQKENLLPPQQVQRFQTYQELKTKIERDREIGTRTVGAIFAAMLVQIRNCGPTQVEAITQDYPTPNALLAAYNNLLVAADEADHDNNDKNNDEHQKAIDQLVKDCIALDGGGGGSNKKVGPKLSTQIAAVYSTTTSTKTTTGVAVAAAAAAKPTKKGKKRSSSSSTSHNNEKNNKTGGGTTTTSTSKAKYDDDDTISNKRFKGSSGNVLGGGGQQLGVGGGSVGTANNRGAMSAAGLAALARFEANQKMAAVSGPRPSSSSAKQRQSASTTTTKTKGTGTSSTKAAAAECVDLLSSSDDDDKDNEKVDETHLKGPKLSSSGSSSAVVLLDEDESSSSDDDDEDDDENEKKTPTTTAKDTTAIIKSMVSGDTVDDAIEID